MILSTGRMELEPSDATYQQLQRVSTLSFLPTTENWCITRSYDVTSMTMRFDNFAPVTGFPIRMVMIFRLYPGKCYPSQTFDQANLNFCL